MYFVHWKYHIKSEQKDKFEKLYGPEGDWVKLFNKSNNYLGTDLYQLSNDSDEYTTIDQWMNKAAYEIFYEENKKVIDKIDKKGDQLTNDEVKLGDFEFLP